MFLRRQVNKRVKELDIKTLELQLLELKSEHRELDSTILEMTESHHPDQFKIQRLKKKKLKLKDNIRRLESLMIPDIDA